MEDKKFFRIKNLLVLCAVFLAVISGTSQLHAQNSGTTAYYVTEDEKGNQTVIQQFSWEKDNDVLRYEFILEQKDKKGNFKEIVHEETEKNLIETSLQAGEYRYKIMAYNFLNRLEVETKWIYIEIIKAYQPKISDVSPSTIYMEEEQDGYFIIEGSELSSDTTFSLSTSHKNEDGKLKAEIVETQKNNKKVKIFFDPEDLDRGDYSLIATNPGGLRYFYDSVNIKWKKPTDFDVSAGYAPVFELYDGTIKEYFGSHAMPVALNLRLTFIPIKNKRDSFGAALSFTGAYIWENTQGYFVYSLPVIANLQVVYQKYLYKRQIMLDLHAGVGLTAFMGTKFKFALDVVSQTFNGAYINANAGACMQFYFSKRSYVEAGIDYQHSFIPGMPFGTLQPSLSVGYQF